MAEPTKFMLGIAGAHGSAPVFVVDAACAGLVDEKFYLSLSGDDRALVCRIDRGAGQLYVLAALQCLMDPEQAYAGMLRACHMIVYMFSAERDTFDANLESDFKPFMRACRAAKRPLPFVALINERRPVPAHERLGREQVLAVLPAGVPILETTFCGPTAPDGQAMFFAFIDRLFQTPTPVEPAPSSIRRDDPPR